MFPVSIHAPARGATLIFSILLVVTTFQSTPLREGRPSPPTTCGRTSRFNPRPCARGDMYYAVFDHEIRGFNPRPCARGDMPAAIDLVIVQVSIHAPARGAT